jgi:capsular exopolysaccharide synthesis family protein
MKNHDVLHKEQQSDRSLDSLRVDPMVILSLLIKNWIIFVIAVSVALYITHVYLAHTLPVYNVSSTLLINEPEKRTLSNNDQLLQGLGLPGGMSNRENQIMILKSRALTEKALRELSFEIEYYVKTIRNQLPVYPDVPIKIISDNDIPLPDNTEFSIAYSGNEKFILKSESEYYALDKEALFGETIKITGGSFRIECRNEDWFNRNKDQKLYFIIRSKHNLVDYFNGRLEVELLSQGGSVVRVGITGTNFKRDVDFVNKLVEVFQSISLDKKNVEALRRIQFIDDQLIGVSDSLSITENKLQQFRSSHRIMDLSSQGRSIIEQIPVLENEKARLNLNANYFEYLANYLAKETTGELPIVPVTMGITDPGLTRLVDELTTLQGQLSARGAGEMNPLQRNLMQKVHSTKDALNETLNGLRRANSMARSDNQQQINKINDQAAALPATERQLLGIERKFKLNDALYTFLLQTRAEQQMQKASNMADSEVIDPADIEHRNLISPIPYRAYFLGLFAGFVIPFLIIFLRYVLNNKLTDDDISKIRDLPVVGNIPHNFEKTSTVVIDTPNSEIAEAFRLLRSRMQFLTKEEKAPVILITSSLPGDGKTFIAINLASVYSLLGKKTILIGFDLRKPKIYQDFNLNNDKGVSTWLIGKDKLQDIIQESSFENLSIITAGPIPPNPSELTALGKTNELISTLREKYDCIVIDSSPIGIVSDTFHLVSLSDACLLIVRPGKTLRDLFWNTINEISNSITKGVSIVINDIQPKSKHFGYGEKYGYIKGQESQKKRLFKRKNT